MLHSEAFKPSDIKCVETTKKRVQEQKLSMCLTQQLLLSGTPVRKGNMKSMDVTVSVYLWAGPRPRRSLWAASPPGT